MLAPVYSDWCYDSGIVHRVRAAAFRNRKVCGPSSRCPVGIAPLKARASLLQRLKTMTVRYRWALAIAAIAAAGFLGSAMPNSANASPICGPELRALESALDRAPEGPQKDRATSLYRAAERDRVNEHGVHCLGQAKRAMVELRRIGPFGSTRM